MTETLYVKPDGSIGVMREVKYGRAWWELASSRVVPFGCYGEEKEWEGDGLKVKVTLTAHGWLEQVWERRVEKWYVRVTEEEHARIMAEADAR